MEIRRELGWEPGSPPEVGRWSRDTKNTEGSGGWRGRPRGGREGERGHHARRRPEPLLAGDREASPASRGLLGARASLPGLWALSLCQGEPRKLPRFLESARVSTCGGPPVADRCGRRLALERTRQGWEVRETRVQIPTAHPERRENALRPGHRPHAHTFPTHFLLLPPSPPGHQTPHAE